jgi:hypothetical protein
MYGRNALMTSQYTQVAIGLILSNHIDFILKTEGCKN